MVYKISNADRACVLPVAQQIVGVCTVLSNFIKCVNDIKEYITCSLIKTANQMKVGRLIHQEEKEGKAQDARKYAQLLTERTFAIDEQAKEIKQHFVEHLTYIGIGVLRLTPFVGSAYSLYVLRKAKKIDPGSYELMLNE